MLLADPVEFEDLLHPGQSRNSFKPLVVVKVRVSVRP